MKRENWFIYAVLGLVAARAMLLLLNYLVDPYDVFGTGLFKYSYATNEYFVKVEYITGHKDEFDSFILGSSKGNVFSPETAEQYIPGSRFYNLSFKAASLFEYYMHLDYLLKTGFKVRNIILTVDPTLLTEEHMRPFKGLSRRLTFEKLPHPYITGGSKSAFYMKYLWRVSLEGMAFKVKKSLFNPYKFNELNLDTGVYHGNEQEQMIRQNHEKYIQEQHSLNINKVYRVTRVSPVAVEGLRVIHELCRRNNIRLVIVVLPLNYNVLNQLNADDYLLFVKKLSEVTDFVDFIGYHSISLDNKLYYDFQHFRPVVARRVLAKTFNDESVDIPEDFGVHVSRKNIFGHLAFLSESFNKADALWK
jgi:hypothetical protein